MLALRKCHYMFDTRPKAYSIPLAVSPVIQLLTWYPVTRRVKAENIPAIMILVSMRKHSSSAGGDEFTALTVMATPNLTLDGKLVQYVRQFGLF